MNQQKMISTLSALQKEILIFKGNVSGGLLTKTVSGEPTIVHDLQRAIIEIMMAASEK
jgi:hypothetical protein